MRLAEEGDLLDWIIKHGVLTENEARIWFRQILNALTYLHGRGFAHRDLKCENILITKHLNLKLADFGFCRSCIDAKTGEKLHSRTFCGSLAYAAPELIRGEPYEPRGADVWSSGVILYITLNGKLPFTDYDRASLMTEQITGAWSSRMRAGLSISPALFDLLMRLLTWEYTRRPSAEWVYRKHPWMTSSKPLDRSSQDSSGRDLLADIFNRRAL
ncbi:unnamed protein product [Cyprideis torosa]|uniref:Protein kinase domain-containing protein n=1 Tax=Cyprideis torosa TaxID=163714 RepID=A0A7R8W9V4_9CRUS|nr:unnamed protein product [Cyprideis torosa]CAG0884702.1 unnamed protein product [Cyprideis torosa]